MASTTTTENNASKVKCGDRACTTGQIILADNNTARKVSSHFFGRNKTSTKAIPSTVWHHLCRMTYQRGRYAAEKLGPKALCQYYLDHLNHQFIRLRLWRPNATFIVQLWESAKKRLNNYHTILLRGNSKEDAMAQVVITPRTSKKGEKSKPLNEAEAVRMDHAEYIDEQLAGRTKTIDYIVGTIIPWIQQEVNNGTMVQLPPIEFLIDAQVEGETNTDPSTNFARWEAFVDGREYIEPESSSTSTAPAKKLPKLIRLSPPRPRPPIKLNLSLARFRSSSSEEKKLTSPGGEKKHRPADDLPLWQPPSPSVLAALRRKGKAKRRGLSVDTALANQLGAERVAEREESGSGGVVVVEGSPRMVRGMVFAAGKPKVVARRRDIDEVYDDETESEGEGEREVKKVKLT